MKRQLLVLLFVFCTSSLHLFAQNNLFLPPVLTGTNFNLNVQNGAVNFYGQNVDTYGVNGSILAPTIVVNKDDSIVLNVINNLAVETTMHWHGLHVAPENDGGPHQPIAPGTTWSPSFKIRNRAGTYWYHPHGNGQTDPQVSKGIAGFFIVNDTASTSIGLPNSYGVDDFPILLQSKSFDVLNQIAIASNMDTTVLVNATYDPVLTAPAQVVRLRLLNGSSLRSFYIGLSNGMPMYQIATDGGLLDSSYAISKLLISPGERAEVLINLNGMNSQNFYLMNFGTLMPNGIYGSSMVGNGADTIHDYSSNFLNGADFNLLKISVAAPTLNPVVNIPAVLNGLSTWPINNTNQYRTIVMDTLRVLAFDTPNLSEGPFAMNNQFFDMMTVNETVALNNVEQWTLINKTNIAHPFHIHDVQFNVLDKSGNYFSGPLKGWKDVVLVPPHDTVTFITKFETFSNSQVPYMYHCHLLHHEDDGMMGSFVVIDSVFFLVNENGFNQQLLLSPNPTSNILYIKNETLNLNYYIISDVNGRIVQQGSLSREQNSIDVSTFDYGYYIIHCLSRNGVMYGKFIKM